MKKITFVLGFEGRTGVDPVEMEDGLQMVERMVCAKIQSKKGEKNISGTENILFTSLDNID